MINAVLVVDKPPACSSHDVVNRVRRITGERSVGHLGTLDPMASGVLPLLLGRYTRLAQFFQDSVKHYEGTIRFGFATDTYDAEGSPVGPIQQVQPALEEIRKHLPPLTGAIQQRPPAYSAKKIRGVPAYKLARREQRVELPPIAAHVYRLEVVSVEGDHARFVAEVSAGTYVRSLVHDLGQAMGCGAHLTELRRTRAGEFTLEQAITIDKLEEYHQLIKNRMQTASSVAKFTEYSLSDIPDARNGGRHESTPTSPYIHPRRILAAIPCVTATPEQLAAIRNGRATNLPEYSDSPLAKVFGGQHVLVAVAARVAGTLFRPHVVLFGSNETLPPTVS